MTLGLPNYIANQQHFETLVTAPIASFLTSVYSEADVFHHIVFHKLFYHKHDSTQFPDLGWEIEDAKPSVPQSKTS